jgi:hypothetical protein
MLYVPPMHLGIWHRGFFGESGILWGLLSGGLSGRDRAILGLDRHVAYLNLFGSLNRHAARFDLFGDFDGRVRLYCHSRATANKSRRREGYDQNRELPHAVLLSQGVLQTDLPLIRPTAFKVTIFRLVRGGARVRIPRHAFRRPLESVKHAIAPR